MNFTALRTIRSVATVSKRSVGNTKNNVADIRKKYYSDPRVGKF